jgi:hypothetical protein
MVNAQTAETTQRKPLRLWPGVLAAVLLLLVRYVVPIVVPEALFIGVMGGMAGGLVIVVWWVFFSRAPWLERLGAVGLMIAALFATPYILHESIATGAMGMLFFILVIPVLSLAFVGWAVASRRLADGLRRATMVATILLACVVWALIRTGGFTADGDNDFAWRWTETPEERLLAQAGNEPVPLPLVPAAAVMHEERLVAKAEDKPIDSARGGSEALPSAPAATETEADWPGFRGPERDDVIRGVRIATDWSASPPVELWRRPIGPGWSSFAVRGGLFYTQEQRGDDEMVACYNVTTGEPVWMHRDSTRFWESNGGAGPRGTPTISNGRVYTFGGTGILNVLNADDGSVVWSRNAATDTGAKLPYWGFSSSPLVVDDLVIVAASGSLAAYDIATGDQRWSRPDSSASYSSPHLLTIDGVAQILQLNADGLTSVTPTDGTLLWKHPWSGYPIVQPALTADGDILISVTSESGMRRLAVTHGPGGWTVEERWTSKGLKPYYSGIVVHDGHAFGFDGSLLACIDVADGKRKWKGGRYGAGQIFLLADQDLLLVLSEQGELALVNAASDKFTELARFPAIDGKTWNHPVLVGDILLVRNGEEMVAFRLSLVSS